MKLYDYYRSTACYRVRIALHYKKLSFETCSVHLLNQGGEHHLPTYQAINPQTLVPALEVDGVILTQSLAIIDYLESRFPAPPLLPGDSTAAAHAKSLALMIACDIHPLNNLRVLQTLKSEFQATDAQTQQWIHHWLKLGFDAIEKRLQLFPRSLNVCYGNHITLADLCLIPQVFNANRFQFPLDEYPLIQAINQHCLSLDAFAKAAPNA
jgi:maleylacetoacetate isomerase